MHQRRALLRRRSARCHARAQPDPPAGGVDGIGDLVWNLL